MVAGIRLILNGADETVEPAYGPKGVHELRLSATVAGHMLGGGLRYDPCIPSETWLFPLLATAGVTSS